MSAPALRPFHRPAPWLALWALAIAAVIAVCLGPPPALPELPDNSDKIEHFLSYLLLAFGAVQLFATRRALAVAGLGLVMLGIGIEFAQGALTVDRSADPLDALANTLGVLGGLSFARTRAREWALKLDHGLFGRHGRH